MTIALFLTLFTTFSLATGLVVEALKKILDETTITCPSNILACIVAMIVGVGGTAITYVFMGIAFSAANVICMILMGVAVSVGSMIGYDKVMQTIKQITQKV